MHVAEVSLAPAVEANPAKVFVGNTVVLPNDARVLVCAIDATQATGIVLQGVVGSGSPVMVQPTGAARFNRNAIQSCHGDVSFDFTVDMAHDAQQDIVLRCRRVALDQLALEPMVTKRRPMPSLRAQVMAMDRIFGCWTTLCGLGLPRGALPRFHGPGPT